MRFLRRALQQSLANILRNKSVNFLCLGIIAFTLLVPGIFGFVSYHLDRYIGRLSENIEAIFYLREGVDEAGVEALLRRVQGSLLVRETGFTSRERARAGFAREFPELEYILAEFPESPFPASVHARFRPDAGGIVAIESFIQDIRRSPLVESVQLNMDWARKIATIKRVAAFAGMFLSAILLVVSAFIIFNVVKLNIFYRREEITILRLVGATGAYIKVPFLLEGLILGSLGGLLACGLLLLAVRAFPLYAPAIHQVLRQMIDFRVLPPRLFRELIATGAGIGLVASFVSLRRFIRHTPG
ncbi:MAG TPA: FtsX-like permease family protein [Candidatus Aminicenantes bacterium]|nr:FtsX-like permease family protein [Candidatus Aminicenantes bacterium]